MTGELMDFNGVDLSRRGLLRGALLAGTAALTGCGDSHNQSPPAPTDFDTTASADREATGQPQGWEQDFSQMPDGRPSSKFWNYDTDPAIPGYNNEAEVYTKRLSNVRIEDGLLILEAHKETLHGSNYTSGRISTQDKFSFTHGKLEVTLKAPHGVGTWPAAWLLPNSPRYGKKDDSQWPKDGEIDFFETVGFLPKRQYPDVHTVALEGTNGTFFKKVPTMYSGFNTYGVVKTANRIAFTLNGHEYHTVERDSNNPDDWPFEQPYFLILNLAMGGDWGGLQKSPQHPDGIVGDGPWTMAVKNIRFEPLAA